MANPALIDELEKQFRDNPRRVFARLANEYRKSGDYMRAIEICHSHVPQQPGYISGHVVLGQALYDAGELDQAQQTFEAALALDPENLIALRQLGDIARNRRDYREARGWYTRLLEVDPQNDEIVAQLGEIALAEGEGSERAGNAPSPSSETQEAQIRAATATAVAEDEIEQPAAPVAIDESADETGDDSDVHAHNDIGARLDTPELEPASAAVTPSPEFAEIRDVDADTPEFSIDAGAMFTEEHTFAIDEQPAAGSDTGPTVEPDDEDVAWIASESKGVESDDITVASADDADDAEFIVAEAGRDDDESLAPPTDDFDFAFETEEFDEPLRPHTGEGLSVIAEEDALAGVQPINATERSPFGDPIEGSAARERDAQSDAELESAEASFEPLPIEDLQAAAAELPPVEGLGGEDLINEMTRWSADTPETGASPIVGAPDESLDEAHADIFIDSEAETIIEETIVSEMIAEGQPGDTRASAPHSTASERSGDGEPTDEVATDAFGWDSSERQDAPDATIAAARSTDATDASDQGAVPPDEIDLLFSEPEDRKTDTPVASDAPTEPASAADVDSAFSNADSLADEEDAAPVAFVTETMAELYLQQGFRNEALDVYRRLSAQAPDDSRLREKIAELEKPPAAATSSREASETSGARVSPLQRSAAAFFKSLASVEPPPPPPPDDSYSSEYAAWDAVLSEAGEVSEPDDAAALALSNGFHSPVRSPTPLGSATRAADRKMSLHDIFGGSGQAEGSPTAGSLDAFFTPEGERTNSPQGEEEGREDLEAFNAWLEGLKK
jgi:tetratricopeptide (TPR) repeat protein